MVREIIKTDIYAIKLICEKELNHKTDIQTLSERIKELSNDSHYFLRVFDDGEVAAFIQAEEYSLLYGDKGWNIIALAVEGKKQHNGYGKALVKSLEEHSLQNGGTFIRLNSRIERKDAHNFYSHLGYKCDKTQKRFIKKLK